MRRLPSLTALRAFEAAARLSSVTAAAAELGISRSAISQHIRKLGEHFSQRLFNRGGRRIEPAPAALAYLEDVRAAFDRLAVASDQLVRRGSQRALSINATPSFAVRWLIPHTAAFQLQHPSIELRIFTSESDGIAQLKENSDLIVRREPMTRTDYVCRRLLDDVSTSVAAPSLLKRHALKKPADLLRLPLLHMRSGRTPGPNGSRCREYGGPRPYQDPTSIISSCPCRPRAAVSGWPSGLMFSWRKIWSPNGS